LPLQREEVFVKPDVQQELKKYVRVQLYTDFVPMQVVACSGRKPGGNNAAS